MRAEKHARLSGVEGVPHIARGVIGRDVQQIEIVVIGFTLG